MAQEIHDQTGDDELDSSAALMSALNEIQATNQDVSINITRTAKHGARDGEYVGNCDPENFTLEWLANEYGAGHYRIRIIGPGGKLIANKAVSIAKRNNQVPQIANQVVDVENRVNGMFQQFMNMQMQMMQQQNQTNQQFMRDLALANAKGGNNGLQLRDIVELVTPLAPLIMKVVGNKAPAISGISELKEMVDFAKELAGNAPEKEETTNGVLMKGLEMAAQMLPAIMAPKPQAPQMLANPSPRQHQQIHAPQMAPTNSQPQIPKEPETMNINAFQRAQLKMALTFLLSQARENAPANMMAETVVQYMSPEQVEQIILPENAVETLCEIEPGFNEHKAWLTELRRAVLVNAGFATDDLTPETGGAMVAETHGSPHVSFYVAPAE